jgi:hypothetical protein
MDDRRRDRGAGEGGRVERWRTWDGDDDRGGWNPGTAWGEGDEIGHHEHARTARNFPLMGDDQARGQGRGGQVIWDPADERGARLPDRSPRGTAPPARLGYPYNQQIGYQGVGGTSRGAGGPQPSPAQHEQMRQQERPEAYQGRDAGEGLAGRVRRKIAAFVGKGPRGYVRSDARILDDVCERLAHGYLDASDIEVTVQDGEVSLAGTVTSRADRRLAEDLAWECLGVVDVAVRLKVARPSVTTGRLEGEAAGREIERATHEAGDAQGVMRGGPDEVGASGGGGEGRAGGGDPGRHAST